MDLITSLSSQVMNKALDGLSMRHKAIASNLANVETPNYQRRDVKFENALQQAMASQVKFGRRNAGQASNDQPLAMLASRPGHIAIGQSLALSVDQVQPQFTENSESQTRNDGNSVDVETEMAQLAKNTQRYVAISNLESRTMKSLRSVIAGGGG